MHNQALGDLRSERTESIGGNKHVSLILFQYVWNLHIIPKFPKQVIACRRTNDYCFHIFIKYKLLVIWAIKYENKLMFGMRFCYSDEVFVDEITKSFKPVVK